MLSCGSLVLYVRIIYAVNVMKKLNNYTTHNVILYNLIYNDKIQLYF